MDHVRVPVLVRNLSLGVLHCGVAIGWIELGKSVQVIKAQLSRVGALDLCNNPSAQVYPFAHVSATTQGQVGHQSLIIKLRTKIYGHLTRSCPSFSPGVQVGLIRLASCGTIR